MRSKEFRNLTNQYALAGTPVTPRCPHALECGGCAFQDRAYSDQIASKTRVLNELWAGTWSGQTIEIVPSPDPYNYRTRMDYVATKDRFGLRRSGRFNYIIELEECHLIPPAAFAVAHTLWLRSRELGLPDYNMRTHEGFLRYLVVRRSPQDTWLIAAVTAAGPYEAEMEQLAALALEQPGTLGFHWLLNDTLTDISFGTPLRHWGTATLPMQVGSCTLDIGPNTFFQNNVHLLVPLLDEVKAAVTGDRGRGTEDREQSLLTPDSLSPVLGPPSSVGRLSDLYGGVGTIALHIADAADEVITVESVEESAELARHNIARNGVGNVTAVHADVLPFLQAQEAGSLDVVVVDPPRTGLGPEVCVELLRLAPRRIVYVSCNPLTQLDDVRMLATGYELVSLRGYDMFPHTPHVEALGVLERKAVV